MLFVPYIYIENFQLDFTTKTKYIAYKSPKVLDYNLNKKHLPKLKSFPEYRIGNLQYNKKLRIK